MPLNTSHFRHFVDWLRLCWIEAWREGVGIEPTSRRSTAHPIGFEGRGAHQSHIPPTKGEIF